MPLKEQQWNQFLRALKSRNCCLLLGPEISCIKTSADTSSPVLEVFSEYMNKRLTEENIPYDPSINNFFYRASRFIAKQYPPDRPNQFSDEIEVFVKNYIDKPCDYFNKLIRLPFNTIVNMVPDNFVATALKKQGYEFVEEVYDYSNPAKSDQTIKDEVQLIYYLFGRFDNPDSVAVTEKNQLAQIKNMVAGEPPISANIRTRFKDPEKSFLFLGFNFNDWYFRLVINALGIPKPKQSYYPVYSKTHQIAFLAKEFYTEKYGIEFVDPNTDSFIDEIIVRYENAYGPIDKKLLFVFDFHDEDTAVFTEMRDQLRNNLIRNRVSFWDKTTDRVAGGTIVSVDDQAKKADVYIPFLSKYFLNDASCLNRITNCLSQANTSVVPIQAGFVAFDAAIPELRKKSLMILPQDNMPLTAHTLAKLTETCFELATIINHIVR